MLHVLPSSDSEGQIIIPRQIRYPEYRQSGFRIVSLRATKSSASCSMVLYMPPEPFSANQSLLFRGELRSASLLYT